MQMFSKYLCLVALSALSLRPATVATAQDNDSVHRVYKMNYWVAGGLCAAAAAGGIFTIPARAKPNFTDADLLALKTSDVPSYDQWSMRQDPSVVPTYENYSKYLQIATIAMPLGVLFDEKIRSDGWNVMLMALEVNAVTVSIYTLTPLGPLFQTRNRPIVYYPNSPVDRYNGNNKNSFYSGHVASAAAASFFMAKVFSDYHPEMGADKYWLYGAAAIPPLAMAWFRLKALDHFPSDVAVGYVVGTVCGILIPEIHRIGTRDMSFAPYSSPEGTGLTMRWTTDMSIR